MDSLDSEVDKQIFDGNDTNEITNLLEIRDSLNKALNKLSAPSKTVLVLYYFNDLTVKEIARVMNCFQGTVKSRLYNSRKALLDKLDPQLKEQFGNISCKFGKEASVNENSAQL